MFKSNIEQFDYSTTYLWSVTMMLKHARRLPKLLAVGLMALALLLAFSPTGSAYAATITVDGVCTLANAITAANTNAPSGSCPAGSGADILDLQTNVTLSGLLPPVSSNITIEGNGNTIDGNGSFRVLSVASGGNLTLNRATVTGGTGTAPGISVSTGVLTINNSTIHNNNGVGGGIRVFNSTATINSSTIHNNSASHNGGGIIVVGDSAVSTLTINNSTISGNRSVLHGGGIYVIGVGLSSSVSVTLNDTTVALNLSDANGGGIYNGGGGSTTTIHRSLVVGNNGLNGDDIYVLSGTVNGNNHNVLGDDAKTTVLAFDGYVPGVNDMNATSDGGDSAALASILTPLADNGGPTFTHQLVSGSPAIDTIPTTDGNCNPGSSIDQRGAARAGGLNQGGSACDSGAFEVSSESPTAITLQAFSVNGGRGRTTLFAVLLAGLSVLSLSFYRGAHPAKRPSSQGTVSRFDSGEWWEGG